MKRMCLARPLPFFMRVFQVFSVCVVNPKKAGRNISSNTQLYLPGRKSLP